MTVPPPARSVSVTVMPVLASLLFRGRVQEHEPRAVHWLKGRYRPLLARFLARPLLAGGSAAVVFAASLLLGWAMVHEFPGKAVYTAAVVLVPLSFWVGRSWLEITVLIGAVMQLLIVELLNSAIEAAIALANKTARIVWALLAGGGSYVANHRPSARAAPA